MYINTYNLTNNKQGGSMSTWNAGSSSRGTPREEAIDLIIEMAEEKGISGAFKTYYEGKVVEANDLPAYVHMSKIVVSATADQA